MDLFFDGFNLFRLAYIDWVATINSPFREDNSITFFYILSYGWIWHCQGRGKEQAINPNSEIRRCQLFLGE